MPDDKIIVGDLLARAILGVNDWERRERQDVVIHLILYADLREAGRTDSLEATVNYRTVVKRVIEHVESSARHTIEALAEDIARLCLSMERVRRVCVRVEKPGAVRFTRSIGVEIERSGEDVG